MAQSGGVEVVIEGSTMEIGNRMYNIANLVGTSVYEYPIGFDGGLLRALRSKKWRLIVPLVGLLVLGGSGKPTGTVVLLELVLFAFVLVTIVQIVQMLGRRDTGYMLQLETAGTITGVVQSRDREAIQGLARRVSEATNNPPATALHLIVNEGTIVNQHGDGNIGQQFNK